MRMTDDPDAVELKLAKAKFVGAVAHWQLDVGEKAALLGLPLPDGDRDPLGAYLDADAETRMRLAAEVAGELDRLFGEEALLLEWLRDDEDGSETPLAFMSRGPTELRAMRAAAVARMGE